MVPIWCRGWPLQGGSAAVLKRDWGQGEPPRRRAEATANPIAASRRRFGDRSDADHRAGPKPNSNEQRHVAANDVMARLTPRQNQN